VFRRPCENFLNSAFRLAGRRILVTVLCLVIFSARLYSQEVIVKGRFHTGRVKLGQSVPYSLTARYPDSVTVVFPDTAYSFAPFEFIRKTYVQTKTKKNVSYDSAVYFLTTFEIDSVLNFKLPVFVVHPHDCTAVYSGVSSIALTQLVGSIPQSVTPQDLPLKTNTDYLRVRWLLNYPILLLATGIFIVALIVAWLVFGKRIRRYYSLRRLARRHAAFIQDFSRSLEQLRQQFSPARAESVFVIWKKYMEKLVAQPYTKYTAREILSREHDTTLGASLQSINRIIYGGIDPHSEEAFVNLKTYTEQQFARKLEEVKHG
jgi:hypothetical protein